MPRDETKSDAKTMVRPVRVSYFDPRTGEPLDHRPEPLVRERKRTTAEERNAAIAKRKSDERDAREIARKMALRRVGTGGHNGGQKRPVVVDGIRYESVTAASIVVGVTPQYLGSCLRQGAAACKGCAIEFAKASGFAAKYDVTELRRWSE